jgi:hypothetical protein
VAQESEASMSEILTVERVKMIGILNELANLKRFTTGNQRTRLEIVEQTLRLALLENKLESHQSHPTSVD